MVKENTFGRRMIWKGVFILLSVLILQIPILLVRNLIDDRQELSSEAQNEVTRQVGAAQMIYAPELKFPYKQNEIDLKGNAVYSDKVRKINANAAEINGNVDVEMLHRSIYEIPIYKADFKIDGSFVISDNDFKYYNGTVYLYFPIGDFKGLENKITAHVDGRDYTFTLAEDGLRTKLDMDTLVQGQVIEYSISFRTKGAESLRFFPKSDTFKVNLTSNYSSPGFDGSFLPNERTVNDDGFTAQWVVNEFNTYGNNYPEFYVEFVVPVSQYQQTTRAIKYSFLIILLVFTAIFLVETITRQEVNYIQYIVTGFSLCLFYLLLLSMSEYLAFGWAYLIASGMTVTALGGYFIGFLRSKTAVGCTVAVAVLYAFIYVLLNLETGSLLVGSLALFAILSLIMYFTRKNNLMENPSDAD